MFSVCCVASLQSFQIIVLKDHGACSAVEENPNNFFIDKAKALVQIKNLLLFFKA